MRGLDVENAAFTRGRTKDGHDDCKGDILRKLLLGMNLVCGIRREVERDSDRVKARIVAIMDDEI